MSSTSISGLTSTSISIAYPGKAPGEYVNHSAFAALRIDGSVVTWGREYAGGDISAVASQLDGTIDVTQIYSNPSAFAALRIDGSVVTWGSEYSGGDISAVASQIDGTIDVTQIFSTSSAFAALRADGSVVTWGFYGGDSSAVASQIDGTLDVMQITSTSGAFAALRADGSVVTWGNSSYGGDSSAVASQINGTVEVTQVCSTDFAFAALRADGSVITWGNSTLGGDSSAVTSQIDGTVDVTQIYATEDAFAALRSDGSVVTWGYPQGGGSDNDGGDSSAVASQINGTVDVTQIYATENAFAALRSDGSVVTWGDADSGGDSSAVASKINGTNDVTRICATEIAFAALRADGSVVTWGGLDNGYLEVGSSGNSSAVASQINGTIDVTQIYATCGTFAALRADGSVVTWGNLDDIAVASQIDGTIDVTQIYSNEQALAALRTDGSVVTWGTNYIQNYGADSSAVASQIDGTIDVVSMANPFANDIYIAGSSGSTDSGATDSNTNTAPTLTSPTALSFTDTSANDTFSKATGTLSATDSDGDTLTYGISAGTISRGKSSQQGTYGTLTVNTATGAYSFAPNDTSIEALASQASETFTVTVSDGEATTTAALTVNLTGAIEQSTTVKSNAYDIVSASATGVYSDATCYSSGTNQTAISADGRYVVFNTAGSNLIGGDTAGTTDTFRKDLLTGEIEFVVTTQAGDRPTTQLVEIEADFTSFSLDTVDSTDYSFGTSLSISADGRYIAFTTESNGLVNLMWDATNQTESVQITGGDNNANEDIYVKDMVTGEIMLASSDIYGLAAYEDADYAFNDAFHSYNFDIMFSSLSADGRYVAFASESDSLADAPYEYDFDGGLYLKDLQTGEVKRINTNSEGELCAYSPFGKSDFSADGRFIVFEGSNDILPLTASEQEQMGGSPGGNIFRKDLESGAVVRVGTDANGALPQGSDGELYSAYFYDPVVSADGRYVFFRSNAATLVDGDTNKTTDIFRKDLETGKVELVSATATGAQSSIPMVLAFSVSDDGRYVVFSAKESLFGMTGDSGALIKDMETGVLSALECPVNDGQTFSHPDSSPTISADGKYVVTALVGTPSTLTGLHGGQIFRFENPFLSTEATGGDTTTADSVPTLSTPTPLSFTDTSGNDTFTNATGTLSVSYSGSDTLAYDVSGGKNGSKIGTYGTLQVNSKNGTYTFTPNDKTIEALSADATETFTLTVQDKTNTVSTDLVINLTGTTEIFTGTDANDRFKGTDGSDTMSGLVGVDNLSGLGGNDTLIGGEGKDALSGGDGDDRLTGGTGADNLSGGKGADTFVFDSAVSGAIDAIKDFTSDDVLELNLDIFTLSTVLTEGNILIASGAKAAGDADDYLIFDSKTGKLYFDADGSADSSAAIQIAGIKGTGAKALTFADFAFS